MEMTEFKELRERVILVGVQQVAGDDTEESVRELGELADTAGAEVVGQVIQRRKIFTRGLISEKGRLTRCASLCGSWMRQALSATMNSARHR